MSLRMSSRRRGCRLTSQVGLGGQPGDRGPDVVEADRADPAQVLGHDHVRGQGGQQLGVDVVDGQRVGDQLADRTVHAGAGGKWPDPGRGQHGPAGHRLWWVVALVGDTDQLLAGTRRGHDLGRCGSRMTILGTVNLLPARVRQRHRVPLTHPFAPPGRRQLERYQLRRGSDGHNPVGGHRHLRELPGAD